MEKPLCSLCRTRHWVAEPHKFLDDELSRESLVEKPKVGAKKITGKKSPKALDRPNPDLCPVCEARRVATKLAVKKHRDKKREVG